MKKKKKKNKQRKREEDTMVVDACPSSPASSVSRTHLRIRPRSSGRKTDESEWSSSSASAAGTAKYETACRRQTPMSPRSAEEPMTVNQNNALVRGMPVGMCKMSSMSPDVLRILAEEAWCDGSIANERRISSWASNQSAPDASNDEFGTGPDMVRLIGRAPVLHLFPSLPGGGRIGNKVSSGTISPNPHDVYRTGSIASLEHTRSFASSRMCSGGSSQFGNLASMRSGNLITENHSWDVDKIRRADSLKDGAPSRQTSNCTTSPTAKTTHPSHLDAVRFDSNDN